MRAAFIALALLVPAAASAQTHPGCLPLKKPIAAPASAFAALIPAKPPTWPDCAPPEAQSTAEYKAAMEKMHHAMMVDYTGNPDTDFALGMIPHHQGAVDMAKIELAYGRDPQMRAQAAYIIYTQEVEIQLLRHWLDTRGTSYGAPNAREAETFRKDMEAMHARMDIPYTGDADIDFARGMIPHHQGAVDMAETQIAYGKSPQLRALARDIFTSQNQEIGVMQRWLDTHAKNR